MSTVNFKKYELFLVFRNQPAKFFVGRPKTSSKTSCESGSTLSPALANHFPLNNREQRKNDTRPTSGGQFAPDEIAFAALSSTACAGGDPGTPICKSPYFSLFKA